MTSTGRYETRPTAAPVRARATAADFPGNTAWADASRPGAERVEAGGVMGGRVRDSMKSTVVTAGFVEEVGWRCRVVSRHRTDSPLCEAIGLRLRIVRRSVS